MNNNTDLNWQANLIEKIVMASIVEQRRKRRWGIFFKSLFFLYLFAAAAMFVSDQPFYATTKAKNHTALIDIDGLLDPNSHTNADDIITSLNAAFKDKGTKGIILRINSPGGSPVQSAYVYDEIKRLRNHYKNTKVYAVCVDVCASGAYYIASAADNIYANPASLVGSIGVVLESFGFVDAIQKLGVQRRLYTSGSHKGFLDPFSPTKPEELSYLNQMLGSVHQQFINSVKAGRGSRLKDSPDIFSGLVWNGQQAKELGLIDGFGSSGYVAREIIKNQHIVNYTLKPNYFEEFASKIGASFAHYLRAKVAFMNGLQ